MSSFSVRARKMLSASFFRAEYGWLQMLTAARIGLMNVDNIVEIFRRVLDAKEVNRYSDFFELGGDSLLAIRVLSAIARELGTELTYDDFIDNPSSAGLFDRVTTEVA